MFEQRDLPFLHWVDERFADPLEVAEAAREFPPSSDPRWHVFRGDHESGKAQHAGDFGPATRGLLDRVCGDPFVRHLEALTGFAPLRWDLRGGGCHQTDPGGWLDVHVDFNTHPSQPGWRRALNLLVYLNPEWREGDGGELELRGEDGVKRIAPLGGRAVLFPTGETTWHGHPVPTVKLRRSIAVYYFTPGDVEPHSTVWR